METIILLVLVAIFVVLSSKELFTCPTNWVLYGESCYFLVSEAMTYDNAFRICTDMGGGLAVPDNLGEEQFIWEIFIQGVPDEGDVWIGCNDREEEGKWVQFGDEGHECNYFNWAPGEPNNGGDGQHCGLMRRVKDGLWDDSSCNNLKFAVCERFAVPYSTSSAMFYRHTEDKGSVLPECLTGHVIKEFSTKSVIRCGSACQKEPRCRSFNIRLDSNGVEKICQLNDITIDEAEENDIGLEVSGQCFNYFNT